MFRPTKVLETIFDNNKIGEYYTGSEVKKKYRIGIRHSHRAAFMYILCQAARLQEIYGCHFDLNICFFVTLGPECCHPAR